jgi:hypothetical protein
VGARRARTEKRLPRLGAVRSLAEKLPEWRLLYYYLPTIITTIPNYSYCCYHNLLFTVGHWLTTAATTTPPPPTTTAIAINRSSLATKCYY